MNSSSFRLPEGGRIDRSKPIDFTFDGQNYIGFAGDTLASALIANGVNLVGRSFKLHRPRGILSAGPEEPNGLVQTGDGDGVEPNARATLVPLYPGLVARSQNCWPSLAFDVGAITGLVAAFLPASFYYKTFKWPSWRWYEDIVRHAAGLGKAPGTPDPDHYHHQNAHCDVLVAGGGPAGLAAALSAAETGARVILADQDIEFGGSLLWEHENIDGQPAPDWIRSTLDRLAALPEVTLLTRAQVSGYFDHNVLTVIEDVANHRPAPAPDGPRQRFWKIRAKQVVLATGAFERAMTFVDNDRPGIMLAAAVRQYLNRYAVVPGRRAVIHTNNNSAYRTAVDLCEAGGGVAAVVDIRSDPSGPLVDRVRGLGIPVITNSTITKVRGTQRVTRVYAAPRDGVGAGHWIDCDLVAMSGGWNPAVHLFSQSGGKLRFDEGDACFVPDRSVQSLISAGGASGAWGLADCLIEGWEAGLKAAERAGVKATEASAPPTAQAMEDGASLEPLWWSPNQRPGRQWIDFQYDVTVADIQLAARENFVSVEHMKRYTSAGMSVDQGKIANVTALAVLAEAAGQPVERVGTTTFRPPFHPVAMGAIAGPRAGDAYSPRRLLPGDEWHRANGAVFEDAGGWQRPSYYLRQGESENQAVRREVKTVRNAVGLFDGSPLGKIEVRGPDAAEFLNRIYVNNVHTLKAGRVRYGLMLNENGIVIDDGVFAKLADDYYQISTTSGGADRIAVWLEEWLQCEWTGLDVLLTPVTTQWAVCTLTGPLARQTLSRLAPGTDLSPDAFPHLAVRDCDLMGVPARIFRVSFTGELCYEINVPAGYGPALWERLLEAGEEDGIAPFGLEALDTLRVEKGFLHVGTDTDGTTTPADIGWGRVAERKEGDFVGKRALMRPHNRRDDRLQFVGLEATGEDPLPIGGHIVPIDRPQPPTESLGYVTSSCPSPTLPKPVALGLFAGGAEKLGEEICVFAEGRLHRARVVGPSAYDPEGEKLHG